MKIRQYLLEDKVKIPNDFDLNIKISNFNISPMDLPRAETIGSINYLMKEFEKKKVAPIPGHTYKLGIKGDKLVLILTPKGKSMMKTREKNNPGYMNNVIKVFKQAYKNYFTKIKK
jgi:hypothetical protein